MSKIVWSDEYSVGVDTLDAQHQKIIELINLLDEYSEQGKDAKSIAYIVNEMHSYILEHFSTEERMLEKAKYPGLAGQKDSHNAFISEFSHICSEMGSNKSKGERHLTDYLNQWWDSHILHDDMHYKQYL